MSAVFFLLSLSSFLQLKPDRCTTVRVAFGERFLFEGERVCQEHLSMSYCNIQQAHSTPCEILATVQKLQDHFEKCPDQLILFSCKPVPLM